MSVLRGKLTRQNYLLYGTIRLLASGLLISFSIMGIHQLYFSESSKLPRTEATVIDNEKHILGSGTDSEETIYTPVLKYSANGQIYTTNQGVQAISQPYTIGQKVEVQYNPGEPGRIYQPSKSRSGALYALMAAIAVPGIRLLIKTLGQMIVIRRNSQQ